MVERLVRYLDQAYTYNSEAVTVCGLLRNVQCKGDGLRNDLDAALESKAQVGCNEFAARANETEVVAARDNARN